MIDARRRGGPGGGGAVVNGDYFDVDMAPSSSAAVRDAPEKSKQLHSDKTMERMQTAFLVIAILFAVGMASWMIAATLYHQKHPRPHHSPGHHTIRKSFHIKGHKLKRRVGEHVQKKHHALAKHMQALRLVGKGKKGGKHRHLLPKRHRPRHNKKKLDLNKFIKGHHKPHNFMEAQAMRLERLHKDHKHHDLQHRTHHKKKHGSGSGSGAGHARKLTKYMKEHLHQLSQNSHKPHAAGAR